MDALEAAKDPWFWYSTGAGYTHTDRAWMRRPPAPVQRDARLRREARGRRGHRAPARDRILEERDRITAEYRELLAAPTRTATAFDRARRARAPGLPVRREPQLLRRALAPLDVLEQGPRARRRVRRRTASSPTARTSSTCTATRSARRSTTCTSAGRRDDRGARAELLAADRRAAQAILEAPAAAGRRRPRSACRPRRSPSRCRSCSGASRTRRSTSGSARRRRRRRRAPRRGRVAGRGARHGPRRRRPPRSCTQVEPGDILVCRDHRAELGARVLARSAAVSDLGGIMAHTAIVSREYGLPAVVGTGFGTQRIQSGQLIEVDGDTRRRAHRRGGPARMSDAPRSLWLDDAPTRRAGAARAASSRAWPR